MSPQDRPGASLLFDGEVRVVQYSIFLVTPNAWVQTASTDGQLVKPASTAATPIVIALPEYELAFCAVFRRSVENRALSKSPVLKAIQVQRTDHVRQTHVSAPSGQVIKSLPMQSSFRFVCDLRAVIDFDVMDFDSQCNAEAEKQTDRMLERLLSMTGKIADAFGNTANGEGKPLGWSVIMAGLREIDIDFDEAGEPKLPLLVRSDIPREIVPYPEPNADETRAFTELIEQKRRDFNARRSGR